jgi:hypothetical protein
MSYVLQARNVISAESDDFFEDATILKYLNKSKRKIISTLVQQENLTNRSLRVLDKLRRIKNITSITSTKATSYYQADVTVPDNLLMLLSLNFNDIVLREINGQQLFELQWSNITPSPYEGYYHITGKEVTVDEVTTVEKIFRLFLDSPVKSSDVLSVSYITTGDSILLEDDEMDDLPEQIENAIIYGAALMMLGQESVKDPEGNVGMIAQIYNDELQSASY